MKTPDRQSHSPQTSAKFGASCFEPGRTPLFSSSPSKEVTCCGTLQKNHKVEIKLSPSKRNKPHRGLDLLRLYSQFFSRSPIKPVGWGSTEEAAIILYWLSLITHINSPTVGDGFSRELPLKDRGSKGRPTLAACNFVIQTTRQAQLLGGRLIANLAEWDFLDPFLSLSNHGQL